MSSSTRLPVLRHILNVAPALNPSTMVDYDPGLNLTLSESRLAPEWLMEQRDGVRISSGTER